jgi:Uma2 family endonuclease
MAGTVVKRRFTADEYERMGRAGILSERDRVELVDGEIVTMTPIGPRHAGCVGKATKVFVDAVGDRAIVHPQNPVRLGAYDEPQPDLVLLRPRADSYTTAHPGPGDVLLIVEIADSSLDYDRAVKGHLYAAAGIPEYWLVDLAALTVWRYATPERGAFQDVEPYRRGQSLAPARLPDCVIPVNALLP